MGSAPCRRRGWQHVFTNAAQHAARAMRALAAYAAAHPLYAMPLLCLMVGLETSIVGLPLAKALELLAPLVYGYFWGPLLNLAVYVCSSPLQLLLGRYLLREWVESTLSASDGPVFRAINSALSAEASLAPTERTVALRAGASAAGANAADEHVACGGVGGASTGGGAYSVLARVASGPVRLVAILRFCPPPDVLVGFIFGTTRVSVLDYTIGSLPKLLYKTIANAYLSYVLSAGLSAQGPAPWATLTMALVAGGALVGAGMTIRRAVASELQVLTPSAQSQREADAPPRPALTADSHAMM